MRRVEAYAKKVGGKTINDFVPSEFWTLEANKAWIERMRKEGRRIIDIGPDFERRFRRAMKGIRPDSAPYNLEREILVRYERYRKVFERVGKYWGGLPKEIREDWWR